MERYLKIAGVVIILIGCYVGVRYISALIHYGCADPREDGPPPLCLTAELGWVVTGGSWVPLWLQDSPYTK